MTERDLPTRDLPTRDLPIKELLREPPAPPVDAIWSRLEARRRSSSRYPIFVLGPALGFLTALLVVKLGSVHVASSPAALSLATGQPLAVLETHAASRIVALSDGSRIELAAATRLVPRTLNDHLFATELSRGRAVFDVVPNGPRRWLVAAADVQVSVLGTRFAVEHQAGGVRVRVERGSVQVTGPNVARGSQRLLANQSLFVAKRTSGAATPTAAGAKGSSAIDPTSATSISTPLPNSAGAAQSSGAAEPATTAPKPGQAAADAVLHLLARADAARLASRNRQAASSLAQLVARYPEDPRAALAAFTLGRIYLDQLAQPAQAAAAFERATALGLPLALAEEGAARIVEAHARANQIERARSAAESYRARFPEGTRRAAVEAWSGSR